ncbi:YHYH protein [Neptunicoccus cionae]|uniref:YHYH protein n=1 Tax=Neptunicoccus cionae TaxID=2035344 RepID=UPI000C78CAC3|nr:YHYH protein [Amylibacter cionae]PLS19989.1 hypothetical protein C0U40_18445 [Amylibacter cionae]
MTPSRSITAKLVAALIVGATPLHAHDAHNHGGDLNFSGLTQPVQIQDCTLANGDSAQCARIIVNYKPADLEIGPFCPSTLDQKGGIWDWDGENAGLYRVDGDYLKMLAELGYKMFDDAGNVFTSDISVAEPVQEHTCINVAPDETVRITALLPSDPVMADKPMQLGVVGKVGIALNGVPVFSDAPSVHHTGHMPALDTCGGHIDPGGWYHWHAASSDIETTFKTEGVDAECALTQDPTARFGFAFDGFSIYGSQDADGSAPEGLDACNGHTGRTAHSEKPVYHYHASTDFPNLPPCLAGVVAQDNFSTTAQVGVGANPPEGTVITRHDPPGGGQGQRGLPPGFEEAAKSLGIAPEKLGEVLEANGGPKLDFTAAAKALGNRESALREALPPPPDR